MSAGENLIHCNTCPLAQWGEFFGVCGRSGRRVQAHAEADYCADMPPRFGDGVEPAGWADVPVVKVGDAPPPRPPTPAKPVPRDEWPLCIKAVAVLASDKDKGAGDTAARVLASMGADALAKLYEQATGKDCGCGDRAARLNQLYPY